MRKATSAVQYHAVTPFRAIDSQRVAAGMLPSDHYIDWDLWVDLNGDQQIPSTIVAVTFNLTITKTVGAAFLAVIPADAPFAGISTINWTRRGVDLANNGTVGVGPDTYGWPGCVSLICGGQGAATHYIIDVTGYYI